MWRHISATINNQRGPSRAIRRRLVQVIVLAVIALIVLSTGVAALAARSSGGGGVPDPTDVRSVSHVVGLPSTTTVVTMVWSRRRGATGYAVVWSEDRALEPPAQVNLPGSAAGTSSPVLTAGSWWFILRTRGHDADDWTDTVREGPFVIAEQSSRPTAPAVEVPAPTSSTTSTSEPVSTTTTTVVTQPAPASSTSQRLSTTTSTTGVASTTTTTGVTSATTTTSPPPTATTTTRPTTTTQPTTTTRPPPPPQSQPPPPPQQPPPHQPPPGP